MSYISTPDEHVEEEYLHDISNPQAGLFVHRISIKPGTTTQSHKHNSTKETIEVLQGKGIIYINGFEKQIKAGDKVIISPGQVHSFYTKAGTFQDPLVFNRTKEGVQYRDYIIM